MNGPSRLSLILSEIVTAFPVSRIGMPPEVIEELGKAGADIKRVELLIPAGKDWWVYVPFVSGYHKADWVDYDRDGVAWLGWPDGPSGPRYGVDQPATFNKKWAFVKIKVSDFSGKRVFRDGEYVSHYINRSGDHMWVGPYDEIGAWDLRVNHGVNAIGGYKLLACEGPGVYTIDFACGVRLSESETTAAVRISLVIGKDK